MDFTSPFTRAQALAAGLTPHDWRAVVRDGQLRELLRGVYVDARVPDTVDLRVAAAALVLPAGVVLARRTAAWVLGVDALDPRGLPATPPVEVLAAQPAERPQHRALRAFTCDDLEPGDVVTRNGVRLTSPLRTACDLGRLAPRAQALAAVDSFLHARLVTPAELAADVDRWRRRRGVRQLEDVLRLADGRRESPGESRLVLRLVDAGFPVPEAQVPVADHLGRVRYRLDFGYLARRLGLEYDGEEYHGPERAAADAARREWITARGWRVAVFRREDVYGPAPTVEATVRTLWAA